MTIEEIRLANLRLLRAEFGTLVALAERCDTSEAYLSQIINQIPASNTGKPKQVGSAVARKLEKGTNKPTGWMDKPHENEAAERVAEPARTYLPRADPPTLADIQRQRALDRLSAMLPFATADDLSKLADALEQQLIETRQSREKTGT